MTLTRRKILEDLIMYSVVQAASNYRIGIVVPSYSDSKKFIYDLMLVREETPNWLKPKIIRRGIRGVEFENNFRIIMLYSDSCSKGLWLDELYASSKVTSEQMTPHCFSVLQIGTYKIFEDD